MRGASDVDSRGLKRSHHRDDSISRSRGRGHSVPNQLNGVGQIRSNSRDRKTEKVMTKTESA